MLEDYNYNAAAAILDCEVAAIKAVAKVESRVSGFLPTGEPTILYERHVMYRQLKAKGLRTDGLPDDLVSPKQATNYGKYSEQHSKLARAVLIDRECALESCSWGMFQIMGYHWKVLKYTTLQQFINAQYKSEETQLESFVRFIIANPKIHKALKQKDWITFAIGYNGKGHKDYDVRLQRAYNEVK